MATKKVNMDKMMSECVKPHALVHSLAGLGLGLILVGLVPALLDNVFVWGLLILAMAIFADYAVQAKM